MLKTSGAILDHIAEQTKIRKEQRQKELQGYYQSITENIQQILSEIESGLLEENTAGRYGFRYEDYRDVYGHLQGSLAISLQGISIPDLDFLSLKEVVDKALADFVLFDFKQSNLDGQLYIYRMRLVPRK